VWTQQIQLTIADMVTEAHDTHHPVGSSLYYEDQKPEALRRAREFCGTRLPKYLQWFESILARNPAGPRHLVGGKLSYADLSLFQLSRACATPSRTRRSAHWHARLRCVAARPRGRPAPVAAYLRSERRLPFNEQGIFRRYPELDVDPG
jgi:glutathione S-transferase